MTNYDETTRSPQKGKSMGQYWDKYTKIYIDHRRDVYSGHFTEDNPPAKYDSNIIVIQSDNLLVNQPEHFLPTPD